MPLNGFELDELLGQGFFENFLIFVPEWLPSQMCMSFMCDQRSYI